MVFSRMITLPVAVVLMAAGMSGAQTGTSWTGTWTLDVMASHSTGGKPTASTLTISESAPGVLRYEIRDTFDGSPQAPWAFQAGPEGSETPVVPATFIDRIQTTRRDGRMSSLLLKRGSVVVSEMHMELSEDGRTLTVKSKATAPNGDTVSGTSIYHR